MSQFIRHHGDEISSCEHCNHVHHHHDEHINRKLKITQIILGAVFILCGILIEEVESLKAIGDIIPPLVFFLIAYLIVGLEVVILAIKNMIKGNLFDEHFLMMVATIAAFIVAEYDEAVIVMELYQIGELLEDIAVDKSHESVESLLKIHESYAMLENGSSLKIEEVNVNDIIIVKRNETVPLDGVIVEGSSDMDLLNLTGEQINYHLDVNDEVKSGSIVLGEYLKIKVIKSYDDSTTKQILNHIEKTTVSKTQSEKFVTRFSKIYTPIVVGFALLFVIASLIFKFNTIEASIYKACLMLVVSCPCAIVISIPLAYFIGTAVSTKHGILNKNTNYLEVLDNSKDNDKFNKTYHKTINIVKQNIIGVCLVKALALIWGVFGELPMWIAIFSDVGVCLLAILNDLRLFKLSNK